eukprot:scaffold5504_cov101-Isochrysis_galbana.AAC.1
MYGGGASIALARLTTRACIGRDVCAIHRAHPPPLADEVSAVVMDIGSSTTKSGYAGEDCPKFVVPSVRAQPCCH